MGLENSSRRMLSVLALLLLGAGIALIPSRAAAQKGAKKLTKQDVIDLLTGDVPSDQVAAEARKAGISFQVTPSVEKDIRDAGGTDDLIRTLRSLASAPPAVSNPPAHSAPSASPPVLMIESNPGQSQVYVDDEPMGTTSPEGRLKLTRVGAGSHIVRVSLNGYQDYEESVNLAEGHTVTVAAPLERAAAPAAPATTPLPQPEIAPNNPSPQPPQPQPQPQQAPTLTQMPHNGYVYFRVAHDHGKSGTDYCVGVMAIGNGMVYYKADNGVHNFQIPLNQVKEVKKNDIYLAQYYAFHIRMKRGNINYNFAAINQQTQPVPPDAVLTAIYNAMGN